MARKKPPFLGYVQLRPKGGGWIARETKPVLGAAEVVKLLMDGGLSDKPVPVFMYIYETQQEVTLNTEEVEEMRNSASPADYILDVLQAKFDTFKGTIVKKGKKVRDIEDLEVQFQCLGFRTNNPHSPPFGRIKPEPEPETPKPSKPVKKKRKRDNKGRFV